MALIPATSGRCPYSGDRRWPRTWSKERFSKITTTIVSTFFLSSSGVIGPPHTLRDDVHYKIVRNGGAGLAATQLHVEHPVTRNGCACERRCHGPRCYRRVQSRVFHFINP